MIENLGLVIIFILAIFYVIKHIKRILINGENETSCQNCPVVKKTNLKLSKNSDWLYQSTFKKSTRKDPTPSVKRQS